MQIYKPDYNSVTAQFPGAITGYDARVNYSETGFFYEEPLAAVPASPYIMELTYIPKKDFDTFLIQIEGINCTILRYEDTLAAGQVGIDWNYGRIKFAAANQSQAIACSYTAYGSRTTASFENKLQKELIETQKEVIKIKDIKTTDIKTTDSTHFALNDTGGFFTGLYFGRSNVIPTLTNFYSGKGLVWNKNDDELTCTIGSFLTTNLSATALTTTTINSGSIAMGTHTYGNRMVGQTTGGTTRDTLYLDASTGGTSNYSLYAVGGCYMGDTSIIQKATITNHTDILTVQASNGSFRAQIGIRGAGGAGIAFYTGNTVGLTFLNTGTTTQFYDHTSGHQGALINLVGGAHKSMGLAGRLSVGNATAPTSGAALQVTGNAYLTSGVDANQVHSRSAFSTGDGAGGVATGVDGTISFYDVMNYVQHNLTFRGGILVDYNNN